MLNFFFFHVYHCKTLELQELSIISAAKMPKMHLCKSSGMFPLLCVSEMILVFRFKSGLKSIHQSRFSCSRMSEKTDVLSFIMFEVDLNSVYLQKKLACLITEIFIHGLVVLPTNFLLLQNSINLFC